MPIGNRDKVLPPGVVGLTVSISLATVFAVPALLMMYGRPIAVPVVAAQARNQKQMPPDFDREVARVVAEIDRIEAETERQMNRTALDRQGQMRTLGKLLLFDRHLSVDQNEACSFCHMPEAGFTGPIESLNQTTVSYPGSVRSRFSNRKPQSYMYAPFAPVLNYNRVQGDFVGGNFWDMRATGYRLQSPSAEQAQGPPTNPVEMGLPDSACVAYRISKGRYESLFVKVWGSTIDSIQWPANAEKVCSTPVGAGGVGPQLTLTSEDRTRANTVYDQFGLSIAAYEGSNSDRKSTRLNSSH